MQNEIKLFDFENQSFRVLQIENEPWFVGKDVAEILGYKNTRDALNKHCDKEDKDVAKLDTLGGKQRTTIINESGLYSLILSSKLPSAKKFKHKVTSEVLPSIRKHGAYLTDEKIEEVLTSPDTIIRLATQLKEERAARKKAQHQLDLDAPKVSYYDLVLQSKSLVSTTIIAKDYGMSAHKLNIILHGLKVQYSSSGTWVLYAKYQDLGWTHSSTNYYRLANGTIGISMNTKWTQKGRLGIYNLLKKKMNLVPVIEREDLKNAKEF